MGAEMAAEGRQRGSYSMDYNPWQPMCQIRSQVVSERAAHRENDGFLVIIAIDNPSRPGLYSANLDTPDTDRSARDVILDWVIIRVEVKT